MLNRGTPTAAITALGAAAASSGGVDTEPAFALGYVPNSAAENQPGAATLKRASAASAGTIQGRGKVFSFGTIGGEPDVARSRAGADTADSSATPADNTTIVIAPGATLDIARPLNTASTTTIDFGGTTSTQTLIIGATASGGQGGTFASAITDFGGSDRIEILGVTETDPVANLTNGALTITGGSDGPVVYTLAHVPTDVSYSTSVLPGGGLLITDPPPAVISAYSHIVVVVEENHNYDEIIGNTAAAPFLNGLAADGAVLSNYDAITHPSQPNYFALYAGSTFGTTDDNIHSEPDPTLATILQAAGDTFTGYVDQSDSDINHNPWEILPRRMVGSNRLRANNQLSHFFFDVRVR